jgi:hypothetical protein
MASLFSGKDCDIVRLANIATRMWLPKQRHIMSITFWVEQAPLRTVYPYADEPDFGQQEPVEPWFEVNFSNTNAYMVLGEIDINGATNGFGSWQGAKLSEVANECTRVLNTKRITSVVRPAYEEGNFIECGATEESMRVRFERIRELCLLARLHNYTVLFG